MLRIFSKENRVPTALITGASSGIGRELARCFARDRRDVVLVARSEDKLEELAVELQQAHGVTARVLPSDLSREEAPREIFERLESEGVAIEYLVNNAGFGSYGPFAETGWDRESQMIRVNVAALTHLTKLFLPPMLRRRSGKILNVASTAAFQPGPLMAVYFATKAYVLSFSEAVAAEARGSGVTVTALCPGPTWSGFGAAAEMEHSGLFARPGIPTSAAVAAYGYRAMRRGKRVAVQGLLNKTLAASVRFTPRWVAAEVARLMTEPVKRRGK